MAPEEFNPINYLCLTPGPITEDMMLVIEMPERLSTTLYEYIEYSKDNGTSWTRTNNVDDTNVYTPILIDDETPILLRGGGVQMYVDAPGLYVRHIRFQYHTKDWYDRYWGKTKLRPEREITETIAASGSVNSLLYGEYHNSATAVGSNAFRSLFEDCGWLTTAPELPATTLASNCYNGMFSGCTSLTAAPELPATTLGSNCYRNMFYECTSLITAPELPATTLADGCYYGMFIGCTSLITAPELPVTTLVSNCYASMFSGCSLTTAPELPATTLANGCYDSMFRNCSQLNYIKAMFTTSPSYSYTNYWVEGVKDTGTFVKNAAATWDVTGVYGIPEGWTIQTANS